MLFYHLKQPQAGISPRLFKPFQALFVLGRPAGAALRRGREPGARLDRGPFRVRDAVLKLGGDPKVRRPHGVGLQGPRWPRRLRVEPREPSRGASRGNSTAAAAEVDQGGAVGKGLGAFCARGATAIEAVAGDPIGLRALVKGYAAANGLTQPGAALRLAAEARS